MNAERGRDDAPPLILAHHHPGRIRVRADVFAAPDSLAVVRALRAAEALDGVVSVTHTLRSGGLLVEYEPEVVEPDAILEAIADAAGLGDILDPTQARARAGGPAARVFRLGRDVNDVVHELTGYRADLRVIVPGAMTALGVVALFQQRTIPRWDNLVYWGYSLFHALNAEQGQGKSSVDRDPSRAPRDDDREGPSDDP